MSSRCLERTAAALCCALALGCAQAAQRELRVCADPDNLPYTHADGSGFENRIAQIVASELRATLAYTWFPQRRTFLRNTLNAGACDVVMGVPTEYERVRTTKPYYRSSYVFAFRADAGEPFRTFDDPRLQRVRVGVQLIGDDLAATPPGHALALRGIVNNVAGYPIFGERPQAQVMIEALARRELDVALVWGPQAAYYARQQAVPLAISPARAPPELADVPFEFDMSIGVRKADRALMAELDAVLERRRADIDRVLLEFGVPRSDRPPAERAQAGIP
ncbi:MAG TPA: quinoprotein dehydrogenase-associated putative ABC transporter substrate-binding protein [Burkholderiales bacterium]|nr:quinoprotein dehydrogenase-associated putative ABC transporter substrate-binding protein [Burkholderiales bacterium]